MLYFRARSQTYCWKARVHISRSSGEGVEMTKINIWRTTGTPADYTDVTLDESGFQAKSAADAERLAAEIATLLRKHCVIEDVEVVTTNEEAL